MRQVTLTVFVDALASEGYSADDILSMLAMQIEKAQWCAELNAIVAEARCEDAVYVRAKQIRKVQTITET